MSLRSPRQAVIVLIAAALLCGAQQRRYVNPLPLTYLDPAGGPQNYFDPPSGPYHGPYGAADPAVEYFKGAWYMVATTNRLWRSTNMVDWEPLPWKVNSGPNRSFVAPTLMAYKDHLYLAANHTGLYRTDDPAAGFDFVGNFSYQPPWTKSPNFFDIMLFADEDSRVYVYYAGGAMRGIYGAELDRTNLTHVIGEPVRLFTFNPAHVWERDGDSNEAGDYAWIEGPWMTRHKNRYYLQYSAPGTLSNTYAVGVYTSSKPLGPFTYDARSPLLRDRGGLLRGTAHHGTVKGPDGNLWVFYHVLFCNLSTCWDRRIAMDPAGFDAAGNMVINGPSDAPQHVPGARKQPWVDNSGGSIALTIGRWTHRASSAAPGRDARYAFDNNVHTWWEAAPADASPWIQVDLRLAYTVDSTRLVFASAGIDANKGMAAAPWQYRIEASADAKTWQTIVDRMQSNAIREIAFDEFTPVKCRFLKVTFTGAPKGIAAGLVEFTAFGKPRAPAVPN